MSDRVRVGVIGTSYWTDLYHLTSIKSHPRAELAAICGRNTARAGELARKYGIPHVFDDYREMIDNGGLHAVVVASPDDLHHPMTMYALDAGLHVVCEKPMALNAQEATEMYEKAEAKGVKHMVVFTHRWAPYFRYFKQLVDDGYVGHLFHGEFRYLRRDGLRPQYRWVYDRRHGLGVLGDFGAHMIDLARWFAGDVARVSAQLSVFADRPRPDGQAYEQANDAAILALEFASGAYGVVQLSTVAHTGHRNHEQQIILHGQAGALEADVPLLSQLDREAHLRGIRLGQEHYEELVVPREWWGDVNRDQSLLMQVVEAIVKQPVGDRLFIDAILDDRPLSPSFYDGLKAQEVIGAAIESHEQGRWVTVSGTNHIPR